MRGRLDNGSAASVFAKVSTAAAAYTVTDANGLYVDAPTLGSGSAITTHRGVYVLNQGATGITNAYGIDIAAQSGAATEFKDYQRTMGWRAAEVSSRRRTGGAARSAKR